MACAPPPLEAGIDTIGTRVDITRHRGLSLRKIAAEAGVSVGTVHNVIKVA
jgi:AcrR family transcriptional regulator